MKLFLVNQEPETVALLKLSKIVGNNAKGRISKRVFQENKACQIFRKMNISYPLIISTRTCAHQGVRNVRFSKFGVFCFLETPVLRFVLLPYYRQIVNAELCKHCELNNKKKYFAQIMEILCGSNQYKSNLFLPTKDVWSIIYLTVHPLIKPKSPA